MSVVRFRWPFSMVSSPGHGRIDLAPEFHIDVISDDAGRSSARHRSTLYRHNREQRQVPSLLPEMNREAIRTVASSPS